MQYKDDPIKMIDDKSIVREDKVNYLTQWAIDEHNKQVADTEGMLIDHGSTTATNRLAHICQALKLLDAGNPLENIISI